MELSDQKLVMTHDSLRVGGSLHDVTVEQILVQSGYLSIKAITEKTKDNKDVFRKYPCGITNQEIKDVFVPVMNYRRLTSAVSQC